MFTRSPTKALFRLMAVSCALVLLFGTGTASAQEAPPCAGMNPERDSDGDCVDILFDDYPDDPDRSIDYDGDGIDDFIDPDDDNDGILDSDDFTPNYPGSGRHETDGVPGDDFDGDGIPDIEDDDDDDDGFRDSQDAYPLSAMGYRDTDGDGVGDALDGDRDGDGYDDHVDEFPMDPNEWIDFDGGGMGDNADIDDDDDGVLDIEDAFPLDDSESVDSDSDGIGDNADPDDDNDGVPDVDDAFPREYRGSVDPNGDGEFDINERREQDPEFDAFMTDFEELSGRRVVPSSSLRSDPELDMLMATARQNRSQEVSGEALLRLSLLAIAPIGLAVRWLTKSPTETDVA